MWFFSSDSFQFFLFLFSSPPSFVSSSSSSSSSSSPYCICRWKQAFVFLVQSCLQHNCFPTVAILLLKEVVSFKLIAISINHKTNLLFPQSHTLVTWMSWKARIERELYTRSGVRLSQGLWNRLNKYVIKWHMADCFIIFPDFHQTLYVPLNQCQSTGSFHYVTTLATKSMPI